MNPNPRRKLGILLLVVVAALAAMALIFAFRPHKKVNAPTEAEGPGTVVIDNTDNLSDAFLSDQYTAIVNELVSYIQNNIDEHITHAYIDGSPIIDNEGNITFTVKTENPDKQFQVVIERPLDQNQLIFIVTGTSVKKTLNVYSQ